MSNAMEIHYSVSGVNQDKVLFTVYKQERLPNDSFRTEQKQIHQSKGQDGYYKAEYGESSSVEICFTRQDREEKLVTFLVNQITQEESFAKMTRLELVTSRLKNMQGLFDIISLNLQTRINYDTDITAALASATSTQMNASGIKTAIVIFMCAIQVFFITQFFKAGCLPQF